MRKSFLNVWREIQPTSRNEVHAKGDASTKPSTRGQRQDAFSSGPSNVPVISTNQPYLSAQSFEDHHGAPTTAQNHFPKTAAEAKQHVDCVRNEKLASKDLERALTIISTELNQKDTHFLLELIQNADDNHYNVLNPSLNITYTRGSLRIDCNEVGFSRANVEALCRIGQSSKSNPDEISGRIGEKGIGFKSVFKVASVVWVSSGLYSFKLDTAETLGMIAPRWAQFPGPVYRGFTSFIVSISNQTCEREVLEGLRSLDPNILLFLRRLKEITIVISEDEDRQLIRQNAERICLRRYEQRIPNTNLQEIKLSRNVSSFRFAAYRHLISGLPHDDRRQGVNRSEIVLAFPSIFSNEPITETQNLFSYLPVRNYGFKFIIQADFLLTANREDIDGSCEWNLSLLEYIPAALLEAIQSLNGTELRYKWLPFLDFGSLQGSFFEGLDTKVFDLLHKQPILESNTGRLEVPNTLMYDEKELAYKDGWALIPPELARVTYVSYKYTLHKNPHLLKRLGVNNLTEEEFLFELQHFIMNQTAAFCHMSRGWHASLSTVLLYLAAERGHKDMISTLEFVRLRNGSFVAPRGKTLIFPFRAGSLEIPNAIEVFEIDLEVSDSPHEKELLQLLGAHESSANEICEVICRAHESYAFVPDSITNIDLMSHVMFLYQARWESDQRRKIWLISEDGKFHDGERLYLHSSSPFSASNLFGQRQDQFEVHFLHQDYQAMASAGYGFQNWVMKALRVAEIPRLVLSLLDGSYRLSPEFLFLIKHRPWLTVLNLISAHWEHYSPWLAANQAPDKSHTQNQAALDTIRQEIRTVIASMEVRCHGGITTALENTYLPRRDILSEEGSAAAHIHAAPLEAIYAASLSTTHMSFLGVSDPDHNRWDFLEGFGVIVKLNARSLVNRLQQLRARGTSFNEASKVYEQLEICDSDDEAKHIRLAFQEDKLILLPAVGKKIPARWVNIIDVVWDGPSCLKRITTLKTHYPDREKLFSTTLRIGDANLKTIISEAKVILPEDTLDHIKAVIVSISDIVGDSRPGTWDVTMSPLLDCRIFPIKKPKTDSVGFDYLASVSDENEWYIADRVHLAQGFRDQISLLAFEVPVVEQLEALMRHFNEEFTRRRLSLLIQQTVSHLGTEELVHDMTNNLRMKAGHIAMIVPKTRKTAISDAVGHAEVHKIREVELTYYLFSRHTAEHYLFREAGHTKATLTDEGLRLYLTEQALASTGLAMELLEQLSAACGIGAEKEYVLDFILRTDDMKQLTESLRRRGYPVDSLKGVPETCEVEDSPATRSPLINSKRESLNRSGSSGPKAKDTTTTTSSLRSHASEDQTQSSRLIPRSSHNRVTTSISAIINSETHGSKSIPNFIPIGRGLVSSAAPKVMFPEEDWDAIDFLAELYVSKLFERRLSKNVYSPNAHWTSNRRSRAGHKPYAKSTEDSAIFVIPDHTGDLTQLLAERGCREVLALAKNPIYHIDISATTSGLHSEFLMTPEITERAQRFSLFKQSLEPTENVFVLIRVYNMDTHPEIAFFVDPWQKYLNGLLTLRPQLGFHACFSDLAIGSALRKGTNNFGISTDETYSYKRLDHREIRLLKLSPGTHESTISGAIVNVKVDKAMDFVALSYAWETSSVANSPFVVETLNGNIPVTFSLHAVLNEVRHPTRPIYLWADAICINQEDSLEKSVQIRLMERTYRAAEQVLAWIGEEKDNSRETISTLHRICSGDEALEDLLSQDHAVPKSDSPNQAHEPKRSNFLYDIDKLLGRSWFRRAWIVQELVLPSKVTIICGQSRIKWDDFFQAIVKCETVLNEKTESMFEMPVFIGHAGPAYALGLARQRLKDDKQQFSLLELIEMFSYTGTSQERDKLFAFLSIAVDAGERMFDPDYDSPLEEIAMRYAAGFVRNGSIMDLLYKSGATRSYPFCSWIPYWTRPGIRHTISTWETMRGNFYAGRQIPPQAHVHPSDRNVIEIQGCIVDSIRTVEQYSFSRSQSGLSTIINFINSIRKSLKHMERYPTNDSIDDVLLWLPIGNAARPCEGSDVFLSEYRSSANLANGDWPPGNSFKEQVFSVSAEQDKSTFDGKPLRVKETIVRYWTTAEVFMNKFDEAVLCVTESGYAGLVPSKAEPGDLICVFHGGRVPFLLRRHGADQQPPLHNLIGEAYIHGIMYGESLPASAKVDRKISLV